jgi:hypothetical protein
MDRDPGRSRNPNKQYEELLFLDYQVGLLLQSLELVHGSLKRHTYWDIALITFFHLCSKTMGPYPDLDIAKSRVRIDSKYLYWY